MREIKFRAWNKEAGKMINLKQNTPLALSAEMNTQMAIQGFDGLFIPFHKDITLMQYTGLEDKNGKEIYEGDIVEVSMSYKGGTLPHRGVITYDDKFGAFATKNNAGLTLLHNHCLHTIEVIGNIYENPELLQAGEK